ncbi:MAG: hypothetical protein ACM3TR_06455 [Caulobacteraceae bacterium]
MFSGEMTIRQWLFIVAVAQFGDAAPTLREVAELIGSSRQNAKQFALKLHRKGYLSIEKDDKDMRAIRLHLTENVIPYGISSGLGLSISSKSFLRT